MDQSTARGGLPILFFASSGLVERHQSIVQLCPLGADGFEIGPSQKVTLAQRLYCIRLVQRLGCYVCLARRRPHCRDVF